MEAWKFFNYSNLSPVYALSFTAERWGLEPFPGNLVATTGYLYWQDTVPVWTLPYSCPSSNDSSFLDYYYYTTVVNDTYDDVIYISEFDNICAEPQPCADSGCLILIEGIGKNTTGPANSSIVGLSHGITLLLIIAIAKAITTMGCGASRLLGLGPPLPPSAIELAPRLRRYHNPPPQQSQRLYPLSTAADKAKEVARCSELLRQMYALDLKIWGMEDCVAEEIPMRQEMMRRANALFAEINRIVHAWRSRDDGKWSREERLHIEEIYRLVNRHNVRRY
jgi:hypothetical protein